MAEFVSLFGEKLLRGEEEIPTATAFADKKCVGVYFSAHWCPPCRAFTPKLAEWYNDAYKSKGMEIVFVSWDRDEAAFKDYAGTMPWLSVPWSATAEKQALGKKYKVNGIPSLVILNAEDASTITLKGREAVSQDPTGENLPWTPKPLKELLGTKFQGKDGEVDISDFDGKKIGLYFSGSWCPPCQGFTPVLAECYKKLQEKGEKVEIIFASSDRDEESFNTYYGKMPWKAIPFDDKARKGALSNHFEVQGIPCLVMLDEDRKVISTDASSRVRSDPEGAEFPWTPRLISEIDTDPSGIDESPSLVTLMEKVPAEEQKRIIDDVLTPIAQKYRDAAKAGDGTQEFIFFSASVEGQLATRVRDECGAQGDLTCVLMDLEDRGGCYPFPAGREVTAESVQGWLNDFKAKKLERRQMGSE